MKWLFVLTLVTLFQFRIILNEVSSFSDPTLQDTQRQLIMSVPEDQNSIGSVEIIFYADDDDRMNIICATYTCTYAEKQRVSFMPLFVR